MSARESLLIAVQDKVDQVSLSNASAISVMTGLSDEELKEMGGVPEGKPPHAHRWAGQLIHKDWEE